MCLAVPGKLIAIAETTDPLCRQGTVDFSGIGKEVSLAYVPEEHVAAYLIDGRLERVLEDWCPPFPGYHLYYPTRKFQSPAFVRVVEALKWREENPRRAKGTRRSR